MKRYRWLIHAHIRQDCIGLKGNEAMRGKCYMQTNERHRMFLATFSAFKHHNTTELCQTTRNEVPVIWTTKLHTTDVDQSGEVLLDQLQNTVVVEDGDSDGVSARIRGGPNVMMQRYDRVKFGQSDSSGEQDFRGNEL